MVHAQDEFAGIRKYFRSGSLQLSYLDYGGDSLNLLLTLHGHMNDARTYADLASRLKGWRIIGLDQRGHGWSDHAPDLDYTRDSYIRDIYHLVRQELGGQPVVILGHSLGGANAYQFAARYPELVRAVIVEDIGADIHTDMSFAATLPERSPSLNELQDALRRAGLKAIGYFSESVFSDELGWGFRSDLQGMKISAELLNGSWWEDWLSSTCPILLIHGQKSFVLDPVQAAQMAARRPNTQLAVFEHCGHGVHTDDPEGFYQVVKTFLDGLPA
jgi:pimeloyl-ACP methyl ester carboxylesterase